MPFNQRLLVTPAKTIIPNSTAGTKKNFPFPQNFIMVHENDPPVLWIITEIPAE